jgi:hypothetical protein
MNLLAHLSSLVLLRLFLLGGTVAAASQALRARQQAPLTLCQTLDMDLITPNDTSYEAVRTENW